MLTKVSEINNKRLDTSQNDNGQYRKIKIFKCLSKEKYYAIFNSDGGSKVFIIIYNRMTELSKSKLQKRSRDFFYAKMNNVLPNEVSAPAATQLQHSFISF